METIVYMLLTSLPCHCIVLFQYWDFPWRSRKLAIVLAVLNTCLKLAVMRLALSSGWPLRPLEIAISVLGAAIYFCLLRVSWSKLLFTYVLVLDYLIVVRGISSFLGVSLFSSGSQSWQSSLVCVALYLLTLPWLLWSFRRTARMVYHTDAPELWRTIWLAPALTSAVVLLYTDAFDPESVGTWSFLLARFILLACVLVVYSSLLRSLDGLRQRAILEERARQDENILALQRSQYAELRTHMEEIRRARHDLRQHQNVIRSFLDTGDIQALRAYLHMQEEVAGEPPIRLYCKNYAMNLLISYYAWQLRNQDIPFEVQSDLPEELSVPEPDLCVILGNLLENGLEACAGQDQPWLRLSLRQSGPRAVAILADNSCAAPPAVLGNGTFRSRKGPREGIGTQSVRYIARKYNGTADFSWSGGVFRASVFLNPAPASSAAAAEPLSSERNREQKA